MEDAFTGYVEHGGLTDPVRIRLLICYLLDKLDIPLAAQTISDIVVDRGMANYFAISNAMSELIEQGCMCALPETQPEQYVLTRRGHEMLATITRDLPLRVREKVLESADELVMKQRVREQNKITITQVEDGYTLSIRMLDIGSDLLRLSLFVPDRESAERVAEKFYKNPRRLYEGVLELLL